jgi:hypothetical protein
MNEKDIKGLVDKLVANQGALTSYGRLLTPAASLAWHIMLRHDELFLSEEEKEAIESAKKLAEAYYQLIDDILLEMRNYEAILNSIGNSEDDE